ncbi:MAG: family 20 glycosylhydrolase, partial [Planctomycetes bacterium]|nr:family 20 glycosylhydrolase [Planctomycetota bacterium]
MQTLCQLIRANRVDGTLPCLKIEDWPSLRWRCFQDDLTRGPSSTLATLDRGIGLASLFKLNLFTYYMEYQYAFEKHPEIGPPDGSLTPAELRTLVDRAARYHIDILGNQQSFGHFGRILRHEQYADLRENHDVLSPVRDGTYQLLDDLYSEVCPVLPFEMFNVCCDETWGLGEGPSKQLAAEIGAGGVYVQHVRRVHDLLRSKYGKRMMMWGDIILQHADKLDQVPKDTIMLTWGYGAQDSFEDQIIPFKKSGYEFFVCPGISNWSRILPDFGVATVNIQNFVRDGARHGAIGMLNTDWEDDGEALQGYRWHGHAWGAECAWNASGTRPDDFNRRIGAVLFGESGDHFGRAIELLAETHRLPGMQGMMNRRFWENDFVPQRSPATIAVSTQRLLDVVRPAIEHLQACRREATVNADLLDSFLFGARRMELIATRMRDGLSAAQQYAQACGAAPGDSAAILDEVERLVRANRDAHAELGREFEALWRADCKPYALDWTMNRYAATVAWYDGVLHRLVDARRAVQAGKPLPSPESIGIPLPERFARRNRPHKIETKPLDPDRPWDAPEATHRLGLIVKAGDAPRVQLPIELDVALPAKTGSGHVR